MTPRRANALTALGLLALLALVSLTAPRWARLMRQPLVTAADEDRTPDSEPAPGAAASEAASEAERTIEVRLFFEAPDRPGLMIEQRSVPFSPDLSRQIRYVVEELVRGSKMGLIAPLHPQVKVLDVFVTARGVAFVDLSREFSAEAPGGSRAELLTVYSIVNSITSNFPAVRRVQLLVDDRPAETLSGHVDLTQPLYPDMTLLAASRPEPSPPAATAAPAPTASPAS
jgi:spore germination protein GerM